MKVDLTELALLTLPKRYKRVQEKLDAMIATLGDQGLPVAATPLMDFLEQLVSEDFSMWKDAVRNIGSALEKVMFAEVEEIGSLVPMAFAEEHARLIRPSHLTTLDMANSNALQMQAAKERMQGAKRWSFATDAARIGFKSRQNTIFAAPDNFATWGPPVVHQRSSIKLNLCLE